MSDNLTAYDDDPDAPLVPRVPDPEFWDSEFAELYKTLIDRIEGAIQRAARDAVDALLDTGLDVRLDWELVNADAKRRAEEYTYDLVKNINSTSRSVLQKAVSDWIESGEPLEDLIAELSKTYPKIRASMIAVTETTRAFAEGNMLAWAASGIVEGKVWMSAEDDKVDDPCIVNAAAGAIPLGDLFPSGDMYPPAHVQCRCWIQPATLVKTRVR